MNKGQEPLVPLKAWLAMPIDASVKQTIERVQRAADVVHVAVMPDVHLAGDVCVGTAVATNRLIYLSMVGGDIGCGMLAMAFGASASILREAKNAGAVLRMLGERIPSNRRNRACTLPWPDTLDVRDLSHPSLQAISRDEGRLQFGTLGSGNHFVELQADEEDRLWLMIHSGSRATGQAIRNHHVANCTIKSSGLRGLDSETPPGRAYLNDQEWARRFALANREAMAEQVVAVLRKLLNIDPIESTSISCDHNHVRQEDHFGRRLMVHRKGAMPAQIGVEGVVPGSMGTASYHVRGKGCADSLCSSAHGAGRILPRGKARQRFGRADLYEQMQGVWFNPRLWRALREEAPESYKDVKSVMRAQRELITIVRILRPVLVYKGA